MQNSSDLWFPGNTSLHCLIRQMLCAWPQCGQHPHHVKAVDSTAQLRSVLKSIQPSTVQHRQPTSISPAQSGKPTTAYVAQAVMRSSGRDRPGFVAPFAKPSILSTNHPHDRKRDVEGRVKAPGTVFTVAMHKMLVTVYLELVCLQVYNGCT